MKIVILSILLFTTLAFPNAAIFSGNDVKILKPNLSLNDVTKVLSGSADPTVSAQSAPAGSLYLSTLTGNVYKKNDSGSSTNWTKIATGTLSGLNLIENPDFEVNASDWTASGSSTFVRTTTAAEVLFGSASGKWDASAASEFLTSDAVTIPNGLYGQNCELELFYLNGDGNIKAQVYDGANVLTEVTLSAQTTSRKVELSFICPSSGSLSARLASTANAAAIEIDSVRLALNDNVGTVAQAQVVARAYTAQTASCTWQRSNTAVGAFSTVAACPGTTTEFESSGVVVSTADSDLPQVTLSNLGPGRYKVTASVLAGSDTAGAYGTLAIFDGTTTTGHTGERAPASSRNVNYHVSAIFEYSTVQTSKTFALHGSSSSGNMVIDLAAGNGRLNWTIEKFPLDTQILVKPENAIQYASARITGVDFHTTSATFTEDTTAGATFTQVANQGITLTQRTNSPGVNFTPTELGHYMVCARATLGGDTANSRIEAALFKDASSTEMLRLMARVTGETGFFDSSNCVGFQVTTIAEVSLFFKVQVSAGTGGISASGAGGGAEFSVFKINSMPSVVIADQVVTAGGNDQFNLVSVRVDTRCTSSPCTIAHQHGDWITSITRTALGSYDVNIKAGVFSNDPICTINAIANGVDQAFVDQGDHYGAHTSTLVRFQTVDSAAAASIDTNFSIVCHGPR